MVRGFGPGIPVPLSANETPTAHLWKCKIWDTALDSKALKDYEPHVLHFVDELIAGMDQQRQKGGVVDLGLYFSFFAFDIMGDLG